MVREGLELNRRVVFAMLRTCRVMLGGLVALAATGCYVTTQALHQNDLFNTRRPIADLEADPATSAKTLASLKIIERVMVYAEAHGLTTRHAYRYVIQTQQPVVSYLVEAAQPDRLEFVTTWFPVIGAVPYLGYFREADRDWKADELRRAGYDVYTTGAGAFSSLGWFDDPIFSSMLERSEPEVAHLFFHELTHRTLWVAGSTEFNENLAEYVAGVLTPRYLADTGLAELVPRYLAKHRDRALFKGWLTELKAALTKLYADGAAGTLPHDALLAQKQAIFTRFERPPLKPHFEVVDYVADEPWNNALVLGVGLYAPDTARFARAQACLSDRSIAGFLQALKIASAKASDPFLALDSLCGDGKTPAPAVPQPLKP